MKRNLLPTLFIALALALAAGCAGEDDLLGGAGAKKPASGTVVEGAASETGAGAQTPTPTPTPTPSPTPTPTPEPTPTEYATMQPPPVNDEPEGPEASPPPIDQTEPIEDENTV
jgi:hypothetical protein